MKYNSGIERGERVKQSFDNLKMLNRVRVPEVIGYGRTGLSLPVGWLLAVGCGRQRGCRGSSPCPVSVTALNVLRRKQ